MNYTKKANECSKIRKMSATIIVLFTVLSVSFAILDGNPSNQELQHDASIQFLMSEVERLSNELKGAHREIQSLQNQVDILEIKDKDVAFFAYLGPTMVNPSSGTTVIFNEVVTNTGKSYDPTHGVFRAPANGTYSFHFVGASPENQDKSHMLHIYITKNNPTSYVAYGWLDRTTDHWVQTSMSAVLHLSEGDRIWVEIGLVSGSHTLAGHRAPTDAHTYFSGFLIHAD